MSPQKHSGITCIHKRSVGRKGHTISQTKGKLSLHSHLQEYFNEVRSTNYYIVHSFSHIFWATHSKYTAVIAVKLELVVFKATTKPDLNHLNHQLNNFPLGMNKVLSHHSQHYHMASKQQKQNKADDYLSNRNTATSSSDITVLATSSRINMVQQRSGGTDISRGESQFLVCQRWKTSLKLGTCHESALELLWWKMGNWERMIRLSLVIRDQKSLNICF